MRYEPEQSGVETKREKAREPIVSFLPQDRKTVEYATFSETGNLAVEIQHYDLFEIEDAVKLFRLFLREKDATIAAAWSNQRLRDFIESRLKLAGQDETFLSKENLLRFQQGFGPMFRELDREHPRMSQIGKEMVEVDLTSISRQSFSESMLKENGFLWIAKEEKAPYSGQELYLWEQYRRFCKQVADHGEEASDQAQAIASRIQQVELNEFKIPWNVLYASHEPERRFVSLLFSNASLFDSFVKMPNTGLYSFPYSYKPAKAAITHVANENFNPDFFIKLSDRHDILVVEIKAEGDDSNRNRAKCRDGLKHFEILNERLREAGQAWRYHFYFLSPENYTGFLEQIRNGNYVGWRSGLMQELEA